MTIKIKTLKGLLTYCSDVGYLVANVGKPHKAKSFCEATTERALKDAEVKEEREIDKFFGAITNEKHLLIFQTFISTGLRATELISLKWSSELINNPGY